MGMFKEYAEKLVESGHAYYCFCTKSEDSSEDTANGLASANRCPCRDLDPAEAKKRHDAGESCVIRQKIPNEGTTTFHDEIYGDITVENTDLDDQVLLKSDGMPTYNFANVVDDHLMNINCVMRGMEYLSSTPKYNLLYDAFGWERPLYVHMPPIMRDARHKLSKRDGSASYEDLLKKGYLKPAIINYIALLGWSPKNDREKLSFEELKELFSIEGINLSLIHI